MSLQEEFDLIAKQLQRKARRCHQLTKRKEIGNLFIVQARLNWRRSTLTDQEMFDLKGKAKWDAWSAKKGMPQEDAQRQYIELVKDLLQ